MNQVLIWHDDHGLRVYDATDQYMAYARMFRDMDQQQYFESVSDAIVETVPPTKDTREVRKRRLYHAAKAGNSEAARELCIIASREGWEYMHSDLYTVVR